MAPELSSFDSLYSDNYTPNANIRINEMKEMIESQSKLETAVPSSIRNDDKK